MPRICPQPETPAVTSEPTEDMTLDQLESALEDLGAALRGLTELLVAKATALAAAGSTHAHRSSSHAVAVTHDTPRRRGRIPVLPRRVRSRRVTSGS
ncbi:MAG: hypothetical protein HYV09_00835 [Deltaproteobacteria bacterium]|nr:hypothetical protein [Deltaproteobacteria bacterium]